MNSRTSEVISNTSPLHYLALVDQLDLLPRLFGTVVAPGAVAAELDEGRRKGLRLPDLRELPWIQLREVQAPALPALAVQLGAGEREAIVLASDSPGSLLLLDDRLARRHATLLGLRSVGTVGILARARIEGRIARLALVLDELERLGFRLDARTRSAALALAGEDEV